MDERIDSRMSLPPLTLSLFGPLRVLVRGEPVPRVRSRSVEWLLALLVLRPGRAVDRAWLAGTLWPDSEEKQGMHNLRDALMHLRKALGVEGTRIQSPTRDTLTLALEGAEVDVLRFDAAMKAGDEGSLQSAVALYTGPLLEGCYEAWVALERESREQSYLAALETLADRAAERGDHAVAVRHLRKAEALDPLRDTTVQHLMAALEATGDPAAALEAYHRLRHRLHNEVSSTPDEATTHLFRQIRARSRARAEQKSRAFGAPEPNAPTPPSSLRIPPAARPPHPLTHLIGRDHVVEGIQGCVATSRLVTLVGAGGIGKTRLALEVAARAEEAFDGGAVWVEMASLADGALVLPTIGAALGIRPEGANEAQTLESQVVSRLSEGEFLLALDNCEHLVVAAAEVVRMLLSRCSGLRVLATSRQRLGLTGEVAWRVPSLPAPDPEDLSRGGRHVVHQTVMEYPAAQLFVERAAMARPGFRIADAEDALAVARICHRLDGIPLAIELAAARVGAMSVAQIASRLSDRFRLLTGGSRGALSRHQTLRALIDWSYNLLTQEEQALLCQLSVFAGGWTLEAARAVCSGGVSEELEEWVALDLLTSLADQSLVAAETSGASVRYRLLETIRQYARDRLREREEERDAQDRHLIHFTALVEEAEQHLSASEQPMWLERLETEHDNVRAALRWALSDASHGATALRLCGAAARFWQIRGHFREGRHWCDAALASPGGGERNANRANALAGAGLLAFWQGDPSAAETLYEQSLSIRREIGDRASIAASLADLGTVEELKGRFESARKLFEESLSIRRDLDDQRGIAATLNYLAKTEAFVGTKRRARELMEESLAMSRELKDMAGVARTLRALGTLLLYQEDPSAVRAALNESLDIQERLGDRWGTGYSLAILGIVGLDEGDTGIARAHFARATAIFSELRDNWGVALVLQQWASLAVAEAEALRAARLYGSAERLFEDVGSTMLLVLKGRHEREAARARTALGDASIYQAAFLEGRSFTTEQAIEYALAK